MNTKVSKNAKSEPTDSASLPLADLMNRLSNEAIALGREWALFTSLYFDERASRTIYERGPLVHGILHRVLQRDLGLLVARLGDPAATTVRGSQRDNITVKALQESLKREVKDIPRSDWEAFQTAVDQFLAIADGFRSGRNRLLAHLDHLTATGADPVTLPPLEKTGQATEALKRVIDAARQCRLRQACSWPRYSETCRVQREAEPCSV